MKEKCKGQLPLALIRPFRVFCWSIMKTSQYGNTDPIAAFATVLGESALSVIRTSGKGSIEAIAALFSRPEKLLQAPGNSIVHGWLLDPQGEKLDEVLLSVFRAPRSYTGEDSIDISCHGGIQTARTLMQTLLESVFRRALPGEFTFRAFMNGKLDLTRAESVMELVSAKTEAGREHAINRLSGALEHEIRTIRDTLAKALAATELYLDYSEDDGVGGIAEDGGSILAEEAEGQLPDRSSVEDACRQLKQLRQSYALEKLYRDGISIAIAGKPNAGKSSLFNRLVREERSIVTDIPGTTRDWIEAWISIEGIPIRLLDTAGLRVANDPVERIGVERSRSVLEDADLVLYVLDGLAGICDEDSRFIEKYNETHAVTKPLILVWNKADLRKPGPAMEETVLALSAETGMGIDTLVKTLVGKLGVKQHSESASELQSCGIASERQKELLDSAIAASEEALGLADQHAALDFIAPLLREAVQALGEITGEISTADILELMFSRFCVGK